MDFPADLRGEIERLLAGEDTKALASAAGGLSERYRGNDGSGKRLAVTRRDILAYAAVRMPATFGAVSRALSLVLECIPAPVAERISREVNIPTIGIGAGAGCDGQVLVYQDMLAMYSNMKPKFVKQFAQVGEQMREAFRTYKEEVAAGTFPAAEHTFKMDETVLDKLY